MSLCELSSLITALQALFSFQYLYHTNGAVLDFLPTRNLNPSFVDSAVLPPTNLKSLLLYSFYLIPSFRTLCDLFGSFSWRDARTYLRLCIVKCTWEDEKNLVDLLYIGNRLQTFPWARSTITSFWSQTPILSNQSMVSYRLVYFLTIESIVRKNDIVRWRKLVECRATHVTPQVAYKMSNSTAGTRQSVTAVLLTFRSSWRSLESLEKTITRHTILCSLQLSTFMSEIVLLTRASMKYTSRVTQTLLFAMFFSYHLRQHFSTFKPRLGKDLSKSS